MLRIEAGVGCSQMTYAAEKQTGASKQNQARGHLSGEQHVAAAPTAPRASSCSRGFLFERGYTVVWSGWDPDVSRGDALMSARFPVAMEDGKPMVSRIREEFQVGKRRPADAEIARLNYPAASTDKTRARLTQRVRESDARVEIAADQWEFVDAQSVRLLPKGSA